MSYFVNPPYYLTAYGLAVKHGFQGSEQEWLDSLPGATFTPELTPDGWLKWTNDKGLPNPDPINILDLAGLLPGGIRKRIEFTMKVKDWEKYKEPVNGCQYFYRLENADITAYLVPSVVLAEESLQTARKCGMCQTATTYDGYLEIKAESLPEGEIHADCNLMNVGSYGTNLPVADAFNLGVIKGSDTIVIDKDGTAHAVVKVPNSAADDEVLTMIHDVLDKQS